MDHQRIDDQNMFRLVESAHNSADQSLSEVHTAPDVNVRKAVFGQPGQLDSCLYRSEQTANPSMELISSLGQRASLKELGDRRSKSEL